MRSGNSGWRTNSWENRWPSSRRSSGEREIRVHRRRRRQLPDLQDVRFGEVSRAGFYEWRDRAPSATAVRREKLAALVKFAFEHSDGTSGYRRIHAQLWRWGHYFDDETVRSVMRELGLVACQPRPFRPITTIAGDAGGGARPGAQGLHRDSSRPQALGGYGSAASLKR